MDGPRTTIDRTYRVDPALDALVVGEASVHLQRQVFLLLQFLNDNKGEAQNTGTIAEHMRKFGYSGSATGVVASIAALRKALESVHAKKWIVNHRGKGWSWEPGISEWQPPRTPQVETFAPQAARPPLPKQHRAEGEHKYRKPHPRVSRGIPLSEKARRGWFAAHRRW